MRSAHAASCAGRIGIALYAWRAHGWRKTGRNKGNTMDTRWLQDFVTLSEVRNFTRAAELRNLSQAAFSRRIQSLEQWLGARLIDRNAYPTQLTDAGERFRAIAIELINQLAEARADIGGAPGRNQIRLAAPYALATTRLPGWWRQWDAEQACSRTLLTGNVHDTVSAFTAGAIDLLVCYHQAAQPLPLDLARFDCLTLGGDIALRVPIAGRVPRLGLAGHAASAGALADVFVQRLFRAPDPGRHRRARLLHGTRVFESEMSDVLRDLAAQGLGVAWLAESSVDQASGLCRWPAATGMSKWPCWLQKACTRPAVNRLWQRMACGASATA